MPNSLPAHMPIVTSQNPFAVFDPDLQNINNLNKDNAWSFSLIDHLDKLVPLTNDSQDAASTFQKVSITIDSGAKIYSQRVDSVFTSASKTAQSLYVVPLNDGSGPENPKNTKRSKSDRLVANDEDITLPNFSSITRPILDLCRSQSETFFTDVPRKYCFPLLDSSIHSIASNIKPDLPLINYSDPLISEMMTCLPVIVNGGFDLSFSNKLRINFIANDGGVLSQPSDTTHPLPTPNPQEDPLPHLEVEFDPDCLVIPPSPCNFLDYDDPCPSPGLLDLPEPLELDTSQQFNIHDTAQLINQMSNLTLSINLEDGVEGLTAALDQALQLTKIVVPKKHAVKKEIKEKAEKKAAKKKISKKADFSFTSEIDEIKSLGSKYKSNKSKKKRTVDGKKKKTSTSVEIDQTGIQECVAAVSSVYRNLTAPINENFAQNLASESVNYDDNYYDMDDDNFESDFNNLNLIPTATSSLAVTVSSSPLVSRERLAHKRLAGGVVKISDLKQDIYSTLCNESKVQGKIQSNDQSGNGWTFSSLVSQIDPTGQTVSPQLNFVCLLHLCNEKGIELQNINSDFSNFLIKM
ncbi:hypothetical protein RCL1_002712 [Eukaryota sp. TZLM3-RCL]